MFSLVYGHWSCHGFFFSPPENRRFPLDGIHRRLGTNGVIQRYILFLVRANFLALIARDANAGSIRCGNHYRRELARSTYTWVTLPSANRRVAMHTSMQTRPASPWNARLLESALRNESTCTDKKAVCRSRSTCLDFADSRKKSRFTSRVTIFALIFFFGRHFIFPFLSFPPYDSRIIILILFPFVYFPRDRISVMAINRLVTGNFLKKECFRSNYGKKRLNGLIVLLWRSN